jgi:hypothetical protein
MEIVADGTEDGAFTGSPFEVPATEVAIGQK